MVGSEGKVDEEAVAKFEKLGICRQLAEAAASLGWSAPTGVQEQAVPHLLAGLCEQLQSILYFLCGYLVP